MTTEQYGGTALQDIDTGSWVPDQRQQDFGQGGVSEAHAFYVRIATDATEAYLQNRREGKPATDPDNHPDVILAYQRYQELDRGELRSRFG